MTYAWITDPHFNFLPKSVRKAFYTELAQHEGVIISGDLAVWSSLELILIELSELQIPVYFVLGNHDYYGSSIKEVRDKTRKILCAPGMENIIYLSDFSKPIVLKTGQVLCGIDGWADARAGDFNASPVIMNDSSKIAELSYAQLFGGKKALGKTMEELSDMDTRKLYVTLGTILEDQVTDVIIVTHVPPYKQACQYEEKPTENDYLPFFCNWGLGKFLDIMALEFKEVNFTVLCGHTHGQFEYKRHDNLLIKVGPANYSTLEISGLISEVIDEHQSIPTTHE